MTRCYSTGEVVVRRGRDRGAGLSGVDIWGSAVRVDGKPYPSRLNLRVSGFYYLCEWLLRLVQKVGVGSKILILVSFSFISSPLV